MAALLIITLILHLADDNNPFILSLKVWWVSSFFAKQNTLLVNNGIKTGDAEESTVKCGFEGRLEQDSQGIRPMRLFHLDLHVSSWKLRLKRTIRLQPQTQIK